MSTGKGVYNYFYYFVETIHELSLQGVINHAPTLILQGNTMFYALLGLIWHSYSSDAKLMSAPI